MVRPQPVEAVETGVSLAGTEILEVEIPAFQDRVLIVAEMAARSHSAGEERGATMLEYALLLCMLSLLALTSIQVVGVKTEQSFVHLGDAIDPDAGGGDIRRPDEGWGGPNE